MKDEFVSLYLSKFLEKLAKEIKDGTILVDTIEQEFDVDYRPDPGGTSQSPYHTGWKTLHIRYRRI